MDWVAVVHAELGNQFRFAGHAKVCHLFALNMMSKLKALFILAFCAAALGAASRAEERRPEFTPQNGFGGYSAGNGALTLFFGKPRPLHVESHGYTQSDGTFRIDQTITFQGKLPQNRFWILRTASANHYKGTLSDAAGRVTAFTDGPRMLLSYRLKGPLVIHQNLELKPDGKTINNAGTITLLGVPVGHLQETIIRKVFASRPAPK
jgi:hypothetical protein